MLIRYNPLFTAFSTIDNFAVITLFSFFTVYSTQHAQLILLLIYVAALLNALHQYRKLTAYEVLFNSHEKSVVIRSKRYSLLNKHLEVKKTRDWIPRETTSYSLYLIDANGKHKYIYGHSTEKELHQLQAQLQTLLGVDELKW